MEIFRKTILYQLPEDITLDEYGTSFALDRSAPQSSFNLLHETELLKAIHWRNIRPCTRVAKSEKKDSVDQHLIAMQELKATFFLKSFNK